MPTSRASCSLKPALPRSSHSGNSQARSTFFFRNSTTASHSRSEWIRVPSRSTTSGRVLVVAGEGAAPGSEAFMVSVEAFMSVKKAQPDQAGFGGNSMVTSSAALSAQVRDAMPFGAGAWPAACRRSQSCTASASAAPSRPEK
jgi:hypothetical protein